MGNNFQHKMIEAVKMRILISKVRIFTKCKTLINQTKEMNVTNKKPRHPTEEDVKVSVQNQISSFLDFASRILESGSFWLEMEYLLPFDQLLRTRLRFFDIVSPIKSIGVVVMRMGLEPPIYALGIDVGLSPRIGSETFPTKLFTACKTRNELRKYVRDKTFALQTEGFIWQQIKQQNNEEQLINVES